MRKLTAIILVLGVILFLQSCAMSEKKLPEPEGVLLGQGELEQLFSKNIGFDGRYNKMSYANFRTQIQPDGKQITTWFNKDGEQGESMNGMYTIKNGQKCDNYIGEEKCWKYYKIDQEKYYIETNDGSEFRYLSRF